MRDSRIRDNDIRTTRGRVRFAPLRVGVRLHSYDDPRKDVSNPRCGVHHLRVGSLADCDRDSVQAVESSRRVLQEPVRAVFCRPRDRSCSADELGFSARVESFAQRSDAFRRASSGMASSRHSVRNRTDAAGDELLLWAEEQSRSMHRQPNKPDAVNPAMALWLTIEDQWRRVTDLERSGNNNRGNAVNRMIIVLTYIAVGLANALLTGCASTRQVVGIATGPVGTNNARIIVSRPKAFIGCAAPFAISDDGAQIGELGPGGQLVWDRATGLMVLTAVNTLAQSSHPQSDAPRGEPLQIGVGSGQVYRVKADYPFTGCAPKLALVSGTPVSFAQGGTNMPAVGFEGHVQQTPGQADRAKDVKAFTGTIKKSALIIGIKGYAGQAYNMLEVAADSGEVVTFFVTRKDTVFTDETGKDITGQRGQRDKRVNINYSSALVPGKYIAVSIRYVPSDYVPPATESSNAVPENPNHH